MDKILEQLKHKIRVAMWHTGWKLYTLADKWQEKEELGDFVDHWECGIELLENHTGCKCVETQWADGGENTRNEPMVTFKWPGVAKLLQDNIMAWEDEAGLMKSNELRRLANIMDAYVALTCGVPFYKVTLIEILERELSMYKDGLADTSCWPGRDPDYEYSVRYYKARVRLLEAALAQLNNL